MRYTHPQKNLVIETNGAFDILERHGYLSDMQREYMKKKALERQRLNEFLTKRREAIARREAEING